VADIRVDAGIFGLFGAKDPYSSAGQDLAVVTSDRAAAIQALVRVAQWWTLVRIDGHEFATFDELLADTSNLETPSWMSDVLEVADELQLWLDTNGVVPDAMAPKLLDVVTEKLVRAGVGQACVRRCSRRDVSDGVVVARAFLPG
jgi:hypothetical protein